MVGTIPDLRLHGSSWLDQDNDREKARRLLEMSRDMTLEELVGSVYAGLGYDAKRNELRTRQVIEAADRRRRDVRGWLKPCLSETGTFLDLGCGGGMLVAAAAAEGIPGATNKGM